MTPPAIAPVWFVVFSVVFVTVADGPEAVCEAAVGTGDDVVEVVVLLVASVDETAADRLDVVVDSGLMLVARPSLPIQTPLPFEQQLFASVPAPQQ